jgi:uncharacterized protein YbaP (TraB family)
MTYRRKNRVIAAALLELLLLFAFLSRTGELGAQEKSFLWKVHSEQNSLFILGSIHFLKKESYPLKQIIEQTFDAAKTLVLEIDLGGTKPEKIQEMMLQKGVAPDGTPLQQKLSEQTYAAVSRRAKELGLDIRMMDPLKPWVVAMTMAAMKLQRLGFDPRLGVDRYLAERARQMGKPTGGLETAEFQLGLLDQLAASEQELLLRQSMDEMDHLEENIDRMVQAWKTGDVGGMEKLLLAAMRDYPEIRRKVIDGRHRHWLPQIEDLLARGENALVVVGAAHLVGANGLIELLKGRGYRVEQQ